MQTVPHALLSFQVLSDAHFEMLPRDYDITAKLPPVLAPVIVLAGDIYVGRNDNFRDIMQTIARRYEHVIYVLGNHEYYGFRTYVYAMDEVLRYIQQCCNSIPNVHILQDSEYTLRGVTFVGGTMWTDIPPYEFPLAAYKMADFSVIGVKGQNGAVRELSPEDVTAMHEKTRSSLQQVLQRSTHATNPTKIVAVTHHAPSTLYPGNWYREDIYRPYYFATDVDDLLDHTPSLTTWIHGHTHCFVNRVTPKGVRVVANARGYDATDFAELNPLYDPTLVVTVYSDGTTTTSSTVPGQ